MTSTKQTRAPGRWEMSASGLIVEADTQRPICGVGNPNRVRNQRIAVAAPDLFAACERIDAKVTNGGTDNAYPVLPALTWADVQALRDAIAKARGES